MRDISLITFCGSVTYVNASSNSAASQLASSIGKDSNSPRRSSTFEKSATRFFAALSIAAELSTAIICFTLGASISLAQPVPQTQVRHDQSAGNNASSGGWIDHHTTLAAACPIARLRRRKNFGCRFGVPANGEAREADLAARQANPWFARAPTPRVFARANPAHRGSCDTDESSPAAGCAPTLHRPGLSGAG